MAAEKRLYWPDLVKGIAMLVVVFSHFPHPLTANAFYTPFFLTVFFFVSGYFFSPKNSFGEFALNKFRRLVVPLVMFGSIGVIEAVLIGGESLSDRLGGMLLQIAGVNDTMWFFACLFTVELLFYWIHRAAERFSRGYLPAAAALAVLAAAAGLALSAAGLLLPWHIQTACAVIPFFFCGCLCRKYSWEKRVSLPGTAAVWAAYILFTVLFPNPVDLHLNEYGNVLLFFAQAGLGTYAFFALCVLVAKKRSRVHDFVVWVGQNTIQYFFFQGTFISIVCVLLNLVGIAPGESILLSLLCALVIYVLLCIPAYIVRRFFPIFLGKR